MCWHIIGELLFIKKLLLKKNITFSSKEHEVLSVNLRTLSNNNYDFKKITIPSEKQDDLYYEIIDSVNSIAKNFFVINKKT